jgi:hypothetical protein
MPPVNGKVTTYEIDYQDGEYLEIRNVTVRFDDPDTMAYLHNWIAKQMREHDEFFTARPPEEQRESITQSRTVDKMVGKSADQPGFGKAVEEFFYAFGRFEIMKQKTAYEDAILADLPPPPPKPPIRRVSEEYTRPPRLLGSIDPYRATIPVPEIEYKGKSLMKILHLEAQFKKTGYSDFVQERIDKVIRPIEEALAGLSQEEQQEKLFELMDIPGYRQHLDDPALEKDLFEVAVQLLINNAKMELSHRVFFGTQ